MTSTDSNWLEKLLKGGEYIAGGFHAVPAKNDNPLKNLPSMHRLLNCVGMVAGFAGAKYIGDVVFGHKINGSQYQKIPRDKVFPPLRFLHGIIQYNPFSDAPRDQWLKVLHQMIPAAGGAFGAIKGSEFFFNGYNGAEKRIQETLSKNATLHPLQAEQAASFAQGKIWRIGAGLSAWMASVTGLTGILYGWTLNSAFLLCNEAKSFAGAAEVTGIKGLRNFSNNLYDSSRGPNRALPRLVSQLEMFMRKAKDTKNLDAAASEFGQKIAGGVVFPFFHKLSEPDKTKIVEKVQTMFNDAYKAFEQSGVKPEELQKQMTKKIQDLLVDPQIQKLGAGMTAGNNGWLGKVAEFFDVGGGIKAIRARMLGNRPPGLGT